MTYKVTEEQRSEMVQLISDLLVYIPDVNDVFTVNDSNTIEEIAAKLRANLLKWTTLPAAGCLCNPPAPVKL